MRIGYYQFAVQPGDPAGNRERIRAALAPADFDLLVLPELCTTGLAYASRAELAADAEEIPNGPTCTLLAELARNKVAVLVAGLPERAGNRLYNSAVVVGPDGVLGRQRKLHLPRTERPFFDPGIETAVFDIGGVGVGVALRFDCWFPEIPRLLTLRGAHIICNPTLNGALWSPDVMRVRAIENIVYTISANGCGREAAGQLNGSSQVVGPAGEVLLRAGDQEILEIVEIDPAPALSRANQVCDDLLKELERYSAYRPFIQPAAIH